ncbi:MAG: hypothetical protein EHM14_11695 [Methanothrix sp.]|nr:MAG: hypothetical protein EHM14_11695 [Methanothrix sp.]
MHGGCVCYPQLAEEAEPEYSQMNIEPTDNENLEMISFVVDSAEKGAERDVPLWVGKSSGLVFVASSPSNFESAREEPMVGPEGAIFKRLYLEPLGASKEDVSITYLVPRHLSKAGRPRQPTDEEIELRAFELEKELSAISPKVVIALGKQAANALNGLADVVLPHPAAVSKYGDRGEVIRKLRTIKKLLAEPDESKLLNCHSNSVFKERYGVICKADEEKRLVFSVIAEPDVEDLQGDIMSAAEIENMAHDFAARVREFRDRHTSRRVAAVLVENEIAKVDYEWLGQKIKKGSWIVGVRVLDDRIWSLVKSGVYRAFSIGGRGIRLERTREKTFARQISRSVGCRA